MFDSNTDPMKFKRIVKSGHYRGCALVVYFSKVKINTDEAPAIILKTRASLMAPFPF